MKRLNHEKNHCAVAELYRLIMQTASYAISGWNIIIVIKILQRLKFHRNGHLLVIAFNLVMLFFLTIPTEA